MRYLPSLFYYFTFLDKLDISTAKKHEKNKIP